MGDFDRVHEAPKSGDTKQLITAIVLGAVLLAVLASYFVKKGPQSASAAVSDPSGILPQPAVLEETPEQALRALKEDPTTHLLQEGSTDETTPEKTPRNPFRMSSTWRASLIKAAPPESFSVPRPNNPTPEVPYTKPVPQSLMIEKYKLTGTIRQGDRWYAFINGKQVSAGMVFDKARVLDVRQDGVTLQHADNPDGPTVDLLIKP